LQRRLLTDDRADKGDDASTDVYGKLELQETLNVIEDVTAPHAGLYNRSEVVISDQNVSSLFAHISAGLTHSKAHISLLEGWSIVGTITSYSHSAAHLTETSDHKVLVFRSRASHNLHVRHHFFEDLKVTDLLLTVTDDNTAHLFVEFRALYAATSVFQLILVKDVTVDGDGAGSDDVVASDHTHSNTSSLDRQHSVRNFRAHNVHNTEDADQSQTTLLNVFDVLGLRV